jgi:hypothetical protein
LNWLRPFINGAKLIERYTKIIRRKLRELSNLAHERELNQKLAELYKEFQRWENGEIDGLQEKKPPVNIR